MVASEEERATTQQLADWVGREIECVDDVLSSIERKVEKQRE